MHSSPMPNAEFPLMRVDCIGTDHPIGQVSRLDLPAARGLWRLIPDTVTQPAGLHVNDPNRSGDGPKKVLNGGRMSVGGTCPWEAPWRLRDDRPLAIINHTLV